MPDYLVSLKYVGLKDLRSFSKFWKTTVSLVISVRLPACLSVRTSARSHGTTRLPLDGFFEYLPRKFKYPSNLTRITGILHDGQYTFIIISGSFLLRMRDVLDKIFKKNKTRILCAIILFLRKSYNLWDNTVHPGRPSRWQYGACTFRAVYLRIQTHIRNMKYLTVFNCNSGNRSASVLGYTKVTYLVTEYVRRKLTIRFMDSENSSTDLNQVFITYDKSMYH